MSYKFMYYSCIDGSNDITRRHTSGCRELLCNPLDASLELACDDLRSLRLHLDIVRQSAGGLPGTQPSSASPPLLQAPLLRYKRRGAASTHSVRVTSCQTQSTTHTCLTFKEHTPTELLQHLGSLVQKTQTR